MKQSAVAVPLAVAALALLALTRARPARRSGRPPRRCRNSRGTSRGAAKRARSGRNRPRDPGKAGHFDRAIRDRRDHISEHFGKQANDPEGTIRAFENLDPAALQKPVAKSNVSAAPQSEGGPPAARNAEPADWEIAAARRRVPVVMYSTAWCGVCKRARAYFEQQRIVFEEHDVDRDPAARAEYLS